MLLRLRAVVENMGIDTLLEDEGVSTFQNDDNISNRLRKNLNRRFDIAT